MSRGLLLSAALIISVGCTTPKKKCEGHECIEKQTGRICSEEDLRAHLFQGKAIPSDCVNSVFSIRDTIRIHRNHFTFDGKKQIVLQWAGEENCKSSKSRGKPIIEIAGDFNKIMNLEIRGKTDGIHVLDGLNNQIIGLKFESICKNAIVNGFRSHSGEAYNTVIANSEFIGDGKNAIRVSTGSVLVEKSSFEQYKQPIRASDHTKMVIRHTNLKGAREPCQEGVRLTGHANLKARGNLFSGCSKGILLQHDARADLEENRFENNGMDLEKKDRSFVRKNKIRKK